MSPINVTTIGCKTMSTDVQVSSADELIACLECRGRILAQICRSGFSSIAEVVRTMSTLAGKYSGVSRLTIRNKSQGWITAIALMRGNSERPNVATLPPQPMPLPTAQHGGYYRIPW